MTSIADNISDSFTNEPGIKNVSSLSISPRKGFFGNLWLES